MAFSFSANQYDEPFIAKRMQQYQIPHEYRESLEMWIDLINDEKSINSDKDFTCALFIRAIEDYRSVDVWFEYCQFMLGYLTDKEEIRQCSEVAIAQVGTQFTKGYLIWGTYLIYEKLAFVEDGSNEQKERIDKFYLRQLSLALKSNDETIKEFLEWNQENKEWENQIQQLYFFYRPRARTGFTRIITDGKGHMSMGVPKSKENPWGNFVNTWDLPIRPNVPGNHVDNSMGRTKRHTERLRREQTEYNIQLRAAGVVPLKPWLPKEPGQLHTQIDHQDFRDRYKIDHWDCDESKDEVNLNASNSNNANGEVKEQKQECRELECA